MLLGEVWTAGPARAQRGPVLDRARRSQSSRDYGRPLAPFPAFTTRSEEGGSSSYGEGRCRTPSDIFYGMLLMRHCYNSR